MKKSILYLLFGICSLALYAQECQNTFYESFYDYHYSVESNKITIVISVPLNTSGQNDITYNVAGKTIVHNSSYTTGKSSDSYTFTLDLNDSKNFRNGDVYVSVSITLSYTESYAGSGSFTTCYIDSTPIQISDGSVELATKEARTTFKVNSEIGLECLLTVMFPRDLDYSLLITGPGGFNSSKFGKIYSFQQNNYLYISSFVPQVIGKYSAQVTISELGITDAIEILVDNSGSEIETSIDPTKDTFKLRLSIPESTASDLNATVNATGFYKGTSYNVYTLTMNWQDCEEGELAEYGNSNCLVRAHRIPYEDYVYGTYYIDRPTIFDSYRPSVRAKFCVWQIRAEYDDICVKEHSSGEEEYKVCIEEYIEVKPIGADKFSNRYDIDAVPASDYSTTIELFTNDCATMSFENLNYNDDDLEWMRNLTITDKITFTPEPNYTDIDRNVEINVYLDEKYSKCFTYINNVRQDYRQIIVYQPSAVTKVNPATEQTIVLQDVSKWSNYNATKGDVYYIKLDNGVPTSTKYIKDPDYAPVNLLTYLSTTSVKPYSGISATAYNENNEVIATTNLYIDGNQSCITSMNGFVKTIPNVYVKNVSGIATLGATALNNTSLLINAGEKVDLNTGFRANVANATYFRARIKPCTVLKSDVSDSQYSDSLGYFSISDSQNTDVVQSTQTNLVDSCTTANNIVYPIPTKGKLTIEIPDYLENTTGVIEVFSVSGSLIQQSIITDKISHIDITNCIAGTYLVKITYNNTVDEWQVIKN